MCDKDNKNIQQPSKLTLNQQISRKIVILKNFNLDIRKKKTTVIKKIGKIEIKILIKKFRFKAFLGNFLKKNEKRFLLIRSWIKKIRNLKKNGFSNLEKDYICKFWKNQNLVKKNYLEILEKSKIFLRKLYLIIKFILKIEKVWKKNW